MPPQTALPPGLLQTLTAREREILGLLARGMSNAAICGELWITTKTLDSHVTRIFRKLGLPPEDTGVHRRVVAALAWWRAVAAERRASNVAEQRSGYRTPVAEL